MHRHTKVLAAMLTAVMLMPFPSYAAGSTADIASKTAETTRAADTRGRWQWTAYGWYWQNPDGTYPKNTWAWLDGNKDGVSECYCFDENGFMLHDTTAANGCTVNSNGQWVLNGMIYFKNAKDVVNTAATDSTSSSSFNKTIAEIISSVKGTSGPYSNLSSSDASSGIVLNTVGSDKDEMTLSEYKDFLEQIASLSKSAQNKAIDMLKNNYKIVED